MVHMSKYTACIRWTAFTLTVFISIAGSVMLGFSVWVHVQENEYKHIVNNTVASVSFIALSILVFFLGFLGTYAILLLKPCLLKWYFSLMLILLLVEAGCAVFLYLQQDKVKGFIHDNWNKTEDSTRILIQKKLKCCSLTPVITSHDSSDDPSCFETVDEVKFRRKSCYDELMNWLRQNMIILATCAVIIAAIQMFLLASSCRLLASIESGDRMVKQIQVHPMHPGKDHSNKAFSPREDRGDWFTPNINTSLDEKLQRRDWAKVGDSYKNRMTPKRGKKRKPPDN